MQDIRTLCLQSWQFDSVKHLIQANQHSLIIQVIIEEFNLAELSNEISELAGLLSRDLIDSALDEIFVNAAHGVVVLRED